MEDMSPAAPYEFAGRDLGTFVSSWLRRVQRDDATARGLLENVAEEYDYGAHFLMANIGPDAVDPAASHETLLLYAVLAVYQNDDFPSAGTWQGEEEHVRRAFEHARELGPTGVASSLLRRVAHRATREPVPAIEATLFRSLDTPAKRADHDREMASIMDRDIRAARVLDSSLSIDDFILNSGN